MGWSNETVAWNSINVGLKDEGLRLQAMWSSVINAIASTALDLQCGVSGKCFSDSVRTRGLLVMRPTEYGGL